MPPVLWHFPFCKKILLQQKAADLFQGLWVSPENDCWNGCSLKSGEMDVMTKAAARGCRLQYRYHHHFKSHTHTHPFNGPLSGTTRVSRYQKGKTSLDFTEARDSDWQWHQLGHMQVCISLQTDSHASTPPLSFFTGRMPFLPPNQQRQSTEGNYFLRAMSE